MDSWDWIPFLQRRWRIIAVTMIIVVVATMAVTLVLAPMYQSTAILAVQPLTLDQPMGFPTAIELSARSAGELIKGANVARRAADALGTPAGDVGGALEFRVVEDSNLVQITAEAGSPRRAAQIANAMAQAYIDENTATLRNATAKGQELLSKKLTDLRKETAGLQEELAKARTSSAGTARIGALQDQITTLQAAYQQLLQNWQNLPSSEVALATAVQVASPATPDSTPVRPRRSLNLLLSIVGGFFLGVAVARALDAPAALAEKRGSRGAAKQD